MSVRTLTTNGLSARVHLKSLDPNKFNAPLLALSLGHADDTPTSQIVRVTDLVQIASWLLEQARELEQSHEEAKLEDDFSPTKTVYVRPDLTFDQNEWLERVIVRYQSDEEGDMCLFADKNGRVVVACDWDERFACADDLGYISERVFLHHQQSRTHAFEKEAASV